ncbi:glutamate 5-kinase [Candidatus Parcubacteria bacterium]|nr:glutamate 5-kinase [Candidatus Parcubacteria bacterium]
MKTKIVIKVGTNVLTLTNGCLNLDIMQNIAEQIKSLRKNNYDVILISSGAVGCGMKILGINEYPEVIKSRQNCASIGQVKLMTIWQKIFGDIIISQNLITNTAFTNKRNLFDFQQNIEGLLELGVIPIVNENDAVSTAEISKGFTDNDELAFLISRSFSVSSLFMLSDYGLHKENPQINPEAELIRYVSVINKEIMDFAHGRNINGRGGMKKKLEAISKSMAHGIDVFLISGTIKNGILKSIKGEIPGTLFCRE